MAPLAHQPLGTERNADVGDLPGCFGATQKAAGAGHLAEALAVAFQTAQLLRQPIAGQILFGKRIWKRMVSKYYFADAEDWSLSRFFLLGIIQILLEGLGFSHDTEFKVSQRFAQTVPGMLQCTVYYSRWGQRILSVDRLE